MTSHDALPGAGDGLPVNVTFEVDVPQGSIEPLRSLKRRSA
jgi:hypothetical protein